MIRMYNLNTLLRWKQTIIEKGRSYNLFALVRIPSLKNSSSFTKLKNIIQNQTFFEKKVTGGGCNVWEIGRIDI